MLCKLRNISIAVFLENMELGLNIGCEMKKSPAHRQLSPQGKLSARWAITEAIRYVVMEG